MAIDKLKKIKIHGTYGDPVNLYVHGFIGTKYGEICKIKSIGLNDTVDTYGFGSYDYSRISSSWRFNKGYDKSYEDFILGKIYRKNIRIGSIIEFATGDRHVIESIHVNFDFKNKPNVLFSFNEEYHDEIVFSSFDYFEDRVKNVETVFTLSEQLDDFIDKHTGYDNKIKDLEKFKTELLKFFKK